MREVQDHYFRQAKREGYVSRAAYKLIEINERKQIIKPGDHVLDCGAAPGGWLQVAAKLVGKSGSVTGIDLQPIRAALPQNVRFVLGDFTSTPAIELLPASGRFDAIISDMAPQTTGDPFGDHHRSVRLCDALLDRTDELLRSGGNLVLKVFEGEAYAELLKRVEGMFRTARGFKPKASRSESTEMFIVAQGFLGAADGESPDSDEQQLPKRKPSSGWAAD